MVESDDGSVTEIFKAQGISEIYSFEIDSDYLVLKTNTGDEYVELNQIWKDSVDMSTDEKSIVIDGIKMCIAKSSEGSRIYCAIDTTNKHQAYLMPDRDGIFKIVKSTFPEGKRKYEMLYLMEVNKKYLRELWNEAV
jgi:hypothetical protein